MLPNFLLPESVLREDGSSPSVPVGDAKGKLVSLTLGITRIIEQESLDVSIWGSSDGTNWGTKPLLTFPQKFYCGTYTLLLDLTEYPDVEYLRVQWKMNRWGRGEPKPMFGFYVFGQPVEAPAIVGARV
jgi:hypothetical protein